MSSASEACAASTRSSRPLRTIGAATQSGQGATPVPSAASADAVRALSTLIRAAMPIRRI